MFGYKDRFKIIYWDDDTPRYREISLSANPRFSPESGIVTWDDLASELVETAVGLANLARLYDNAINIVNEYGVSKVRLAIRKATAIASVYVEFEPDYEIVDKVDRGELQTAISTYGTLDTVDRYILVGLGLDDLLRQAGTVIVASLGKDNLYKEKDDA